MRGFAERADVEDVERLLGITGALSLGTAIPKAWLIVFASLTTGLLFLGCLFPYAFFRALPRATNRWIRERLLGGKIPEVPVTVDAQLPDRPDQTLRERMQVTRQDFCWKCHRQMDPLGLPLENYDHFGRVCTS